MATYFVLAPLAVLLILNIPRGRIGRDAPFPTAVALAVLEAAAALLVPPEAISAPSVLLGPVAFSFAADRLSLLVILMVGIVSLAALGVGYGTIEKGEELRRFSCLMILALAAMNGIALSTDLFTLYVFLEVAAIVAYILIVSKRDRDSLEGAFKYLVLSAAASLMMLCSIALFLLAAGDTSFASAAASVRAAGPRWQPLLACGLFAGGLCIKSGLVPFHGWLPDAYASAPPAVTVLLAGIVTKATGAYAIMRLASSVFGYAFRIGPALTLIGLATVVLGALGAMGQRDIKRMLAYSSISQVGYVFLGLGTGTELGFAAACSQLFNHALFKTQLFVNAAAIERQAGTRDIDALGNLSRDMPITGWTSVVAFLSAAAIPPLAGFWSKLLSVIALWKAGSVAVAIVAIFTGLLTMAYFLYFQRRLFFGKPAARESAGGRRIVEAPFCMVAPAVVLAAVTLGVGILFPLTFGTLILPIAAIP